MDMGDPTRGIIWLVLVLSLWCASWSGGANGLRVPTWRFPSRLDLFSSLPAVLRGDAGAGLVDLHGPGASPSSLSSVLGQRS